MDHGLLLENLLDLAHAPFTHTTTFAKGWPVPEVVKFKAAQLLGGNWEPYPIDMSFEPPCMVLSTIGASGILVIPEPTGQGSNVVEHVIFASLHAQAVESVCLRALKSDEHIMEKVAVQPACKWHLRAAARRCRGRRPVRAPTTLAAMQQQLATVETIPSTQMAAHCMLLLLLLQAWRNQAR